MNIIFCSSGLLEGNVFPLKEGVSFGRSSDNDIVIKDSFVSKKHCFVKYYYDDIYLIDNNSHNGIFINNLKYRMKRLNQGDKIKIGKNFFIYYEGEEDLFKRDYTINSFKQKETVKFNLLKEAEYHENYLQIFYKIISPYLQSNNREVFWRGLKNIVFKFNIENFLLAEILPDNKLLKKEVLTSFYDKLPNIDIKTIMLLKEDNIVTLTRSIASANLMEYLVLYPFKRGDSLFVWLLGRFSQGELKEELNQIYFTGLILSFLK